MTDLKTSRNDTATRIARRVNDVLAPWNLAVVMPPLLGALTTTPPVRGALLGAIISVLGGLVPAAIIWRGIRAGRYQDRFIVRREDRPRLLVTVMGLVTAGWILTWLLGASRTLLGFIALMVLMAAVTAVVSRRWKMSVHALLVTASATVLTILVPWSAALLLLVPLIVWARWYVNGHTFYQLVVGAGVGATFGVAAGAL